MPTLAGAFTGTLIDAYAQNRSEHLKAKTQKLRNPAILKQLRNETEVPFSAVAASRHPRNDPPSLLPHKWCPPQR